MIITGYGTDAAEARAKAAGVTSFLHKPLSPEMIEDSARDALAVPAASAEPVIAAATAEALLAEAAPAGRVLKNIALFFAAPFIGLAYIVAFPFVGLGVFALLAGRVAAKNETVKAVAVVLKHVAMAIAAPIFGLVYFVLFPFIGLAMLLWMAGKALSHGRDCGRREMLLSMAGKASARRRSQRIKAHVPTGPSLKHGRWPRPGDFPRPFFKRRAKNPRRKASRGRKVKS